MSGSTDLTLLVWNTFLLRPPSFVPRRFVPGLDQGVDERASQIGHAVAGQYDVLALTEVFDDHVESALLAGLESADHRPASPTPTSPTNAAAPTAATGASVSGHAGATSGVERRVIHGPPPGRGPGRVGSGLLTVVEPHAADRWHVTRVSGQPFHTHGHHLQDADAWATKGVAMVELSPVSPNDSSTTAAAPGIEIVVTHMFAGGLGITRPDRARAARLRMRQMTELVDLVSAWHRRDNALIVCGDFNINFAERVAGSHTFGEAQFARAALGQLGLVDAWDLAGKGEGWTSHHSRLDALCRPDPTDPRFADDSDDNGPEPDDPHERLDAIFLPEPGSPGPQVEVRKIRRRAFPTTEPRAWKPVSTLSDHMALHLELSVIG